MNNKDLKNGEVVRVKSWKDKEEKGGGDQAAAVEVVEVVEEVKGGDSRKEKGRAVLNEAFEGASVFGRTLMKRASPTLETIKARMASYARRGLETLAGMVGFGVEAKEKAVEYTVDAVRGVESVAESVLEREERYKRVGDIASQSLSRILGKDMKLTYAQSLALGTALEASGLAEKILKGVANSAEDLVASAELPVLIVKEIILNQELRKQFITDLEKAGVYVANEITELAMSLGSKALTVAVDAGKKALKSAAVVSAGAAGYAAGTALNAAGPMIGAAISAAGSMAAAAAPALAVGSAGLVTVGVVGYGAYEAGKALEPRIIEGIAGTVAPMVELAANIVEAPNDMKREIRRGFSEVVSEMNALAKRAVKSIEAAQRRVSAAIDIARESSNSMRMALAGNIESDALRNIESANDMLIALGVEKTDDAKTV